MIEKVLIEYIESARTMKDLVILRKIIATDTDLNLSPRLARKAITSINEKIHEFGVDNAVKEFIEMMF